MKITTTALGSLVPLGYSHLAQWKRGSLNYIYSAKFLLNKYKLNCLVIFSVRFHFLDAKKNLEKKSGFCVIFVFLKSETVTQPR